MHDELICTWSPHGFRDRLEEDLQLISWSTRRSATPRFLLVNAPRAALADRVPPSFAVSGRQDLNLRPLDPQNGGVSVPARHTRSTSFGGQSVRGQSSTTRRACGPQMVPRTGTAVGRSRCVSLQLGMREGRDGTRRTGMMRDCEQPRVIPRLRLPATVDQHGNARGPQREPCSCERVAHSNPRRRRYWGTGRSRTHDRPRHTVDGRVSSSSAWSWSCRRWPFSSCGWSTTSGPDLAGWGQQRLARRVDGTPPGWVGYLMQTRG